MNPEPETLTVAGAIALAWLVGQVVAWTRMEREARGEVGQFIGLRFARDWPLLVVLLAPLAANAVEREYAHWLLIAVVGIIAWWVAEAEGAFRQPMSLTRDPLRCAVVAARRLWRSRWLVLILVALWMLAWAFEAAMWSVWVHSDPELRTRAEQQMEQQKPWAEGLATRLRLDYMENTLRGTIGHRFPSADSGLGGGWAFVVLALAAGFGYLRYGSALGDEHRRRMAWPFRLTVLYALVSLEQHLWLLRSSGDAQLGAWMMWGVSALTFLWAAPATAAVWAILLQVARGRRWNPREALMDASQTWPLFLPLLALLYLPVELAFRPVGVTSFPSDAEQLVNHTITEAAMVLRVALFLVPWLIIDRRVGIRVALAQTWALAAARASDLMAFVLRYAAAAAVLMVVIDLLAPWGYRGPLNALTLLRTLAWGPIAVLGTLAVGVLYLRLREETGAPAAKESSEDLEPG